MCGDQVIPPRTMEFSYCDYCERYMPNCDMTFIQVDPNSDGILWPNQLRMHNYRMAFCSGECFDIIYETGCIKKGKVLGIYEKEYEEVKKRHELEKKRKIINNDANLLIPSEYYEWELTNKYVMKVIEQMEDEVERITERLETRKYFLDHARAVFNKKAKDS